EEPRAPRRLNRAVPAELETIVQKAMEKNPAERYGTAQELADDLQRFLEDRPIRARRPGLGQRLGQWGRGDRAGRGGGGGGAGLAGSVGWAVRDEAARRAATARVVVAALEESASWQGRRRVPEALAAARRANELLAGSGADEALAQRARARLADLELLARLED